MRIEELPTPGIVPNGQKLIVELVKTINYLQLMAMQSTATPGKTDHGAAVAATLTAALAAVNAVKAP